MGFFSNWPFSNLHNLNLDWLIEQVKKLTVLSEQIWERVKPLPGGDPSTVTAAQAYGAATYAEQAAEQAGASAKTANTAINAHTADTSNPHQVTAAQVGAEPAFTLLAVAKGGTGGYNPETARASLNARKDFSILPVSDGGTGSSTPAGAREALGITPANIGAKPAFDVLPISQGGTGSDSAAGARSALGVTVKNIGAVAQAGDTMTGSLAISLPDADAMIKCKRPDNSVGINFGVGKTARGIYDSTLQRWVFGVYDGRIDIGIEGCILSIKSNGTVTINGNQITTQ